MLRLTLGVEEYLMIGDDIKIAFLGGSKNHLRILVDAPRDKSVVRSTVVEKNTTDPEELAKLPKFYAEGKLQKDISQKRYNRRSSAEQ